MYKKKIKLLLNKHWVWCAGHWVGAVNAALRELSNGAYSHEAYVLAVSLKTDNRQENADSNTFYNENLVGRCVVKD